MAEDWTETVQKTTSQQEFRNSRNDNLMWQADASFGEGRAPVPTPGDRLTGGESEREIGRGSHRHDNSASYDSEVQEMERRKAGAEREALGDQYQGDSAAGTDSNLEAEKTQARVEGMIGNPD
jgi:hypothetical protein